MLLSGKENWQNGDHHGLHYAAQKFLQSLLQKAMLRQEKQPARQEATYPAK
jgi:hypothetical protein